MPDLPHPAYPAPTPFALQSPPTIPVFTPWGISSESHHILLSDLSTCNLLSCPLSIAFCHPPNLQLLIRTNLDSQPSHPIPTLARDPAVKPFLRWPCHQPHQSYPHPCHFPSSNLTCTQCEDFYMGETKNSLSIRMNGQRSSSNNPNNLPLPVTLHTKSHQLPFNSCWNVCVLQNLPKTIHIILNLPINSFCSQDTALVISLNHLHSSLLPVLSPGGSYLKLSYGAIFTVFTLI